MDDLYLLSSMIKAEAIRLGFDGCGISHAERLHEDAGYLEKWLGNKYHASMNYMENHADKRSDPTLLVENAQSVISVILNYYPSEKQQDPQAPVISKYAYGKDYHDVMKKKLRTLLGFIQQNIAPANGRTFVDSAPVLDRAWAARAGLGWIGKNSMLISPKKGSFFFIGSLIVDIPLTYDCSITDFCGDCNRCIRSCPTGAIVAPKIVDSNKCISFLTIENRDEIDAAFKELFSNRVFGCDICQDVCPWNRKTEPGKTPEFKPLTGLLEMKRSQWYRLDEEQYRKIFAGSAVRRTKFTGLQRNLRFIGSEGDYLNDEPASPRQ